MNKYIEKNIIYINNRNLFKYVSYRDSTIKEAMKKLNNTKELFQVVIDKNKIVLGTLTDGDIRRAFLSGLSINDKIYKCMNIKPLLGNHDNYENNIIKLNKVDSEPLFLPVVNKNNKIESILIKSVMSEINQALVLVEDVGSPIGKKWKVPLFKLNYSNQESLIAQKVINSQWLTIGENTVSLEKQFGKFLGNNTNCIAVSSCTAALHLSMIACGVKPGDEVIVPSLSFIAQINLIKNMGAKPVLVDCKSLNDWNMNTEAMMKNINKKTKAIIILHYAGYPCNISEKIKNLCKEKNIYLIEDVAHAPGAEINNYKCGTLGDISCFSFFSNKNISAGEGGLVATNNSVLEKKIRYLRSHGMTALSLDKIKGRAVDYDVVTPGLNYRLNEIAAGLALTQLKKLKKANKNRGKHVALYQKLLKNTDIEFPFMQVNEKAISAYHIMPILLPKNLNRRKIMTELQNLGIQTSIHYPSFWSFSAYKDIFKEDNFPICSEICNRGVTLPLYPSMTAEDVKLVCNSIVGAIE